MSSFTDENFRAMAQRLLARVPLLQNRATIERYVAEKKANGIKVGTLGVDLSVLTDLAQVQGQRPFESVTRDDVVTYMNRTTKKRRFVSRGKDGHVTEVARDVELSPRTLSRRRQVLRQFFRWLRSTEEYPPEVRGIKVRKPPNDAVASDAILTHDEVRRLLQAHPDPREKALLAFLYESGMRAGEICALNVGSVAFDEFGAVVIIPKGAPGLKTGSRRVRLYQTESGQYLHAWFELHPNKEDPAQPLFFSMSRRAPGARLTASALWQFVNRAGPKAGLKKHVHPHLFRHTAATERARMGWTEYDMRAFFGWTRSSDMPSHYVHLAGKDYEERDLERRGLKPKGDALRTGLSPRLCRICQAMNLSTAMFCQKCRNPISPEAEKELERKRKHEISEVVAEMIFNLGQHVGAGRPVFVAPSLSEVRGVTGEELEARANPARTAQEAIARVKARRARATG